MTKFNFSFLFALLLCGSMVQAQSTFFTEDFDGGLPAEWTAMEVAGNGGAASNWEHTTSGPAGAFATAPLTSTSAANGWMQFDSDLNCSGNQDVWLISPAIDASDKAVVFLEFETVYANYVDIASIQVSTDLENWTEFLAFPNIATNEYAGGGTTSSGPAENPFLARVNISSAAAGEPVFYFAFRFLSDGSVGAQGGCGYSWQVDDVAVTDVDPRPANDLKTNTFFAIAPNYWTPASQVDAFGFMADVENAGSSAQTGANLNVSIENSTNASEVFSADLAYPEFEVDQLIENVFFPETFTPAAEPALYEGTYTLTIDGQTDDVPDNNTQSFTFGISDTLFAKADAPTRNASPADDDSYSWGNIYYVPQGAGFYARYMSFGFANPADVTGSFVSTFLFKWEGDLNEDGMANEDEYGAAPIAFNSYEFTGNEAANEIITIPVELDGNAIELEDDSYYMVVVRYETSTETQLAMLANDNIDYAAMVFMSDSLGTPRYAGALDVGNTNDYSLIGFGYNIVPFVNLSVSDDPNLTKTVRILDEANKVEIAPNPVSDVLRLNLDFVNTANNVEIGIFDVMGRNLQLQQFSKLKAQSLTYDVSQWQSGTYFVRVKTEEGIRTKRFIVQ